MKNYICRATGPYPEVVALAMPQSTLPLLQTLLFGREGIFVSFSDLMYAELVAEGIAPELSELLDAMAMVDLAHLRMLAHVVLLGGGQPIPQKNSSVRGRRNTSFFQKTASFSEILGELLMRKQRLQNTLSHATSACRDTAVQKLLSRISADVAVHIDLLDILLQEHIK